MKRKIRRAVGWICLVAAAGPLAAAQPPASRSPANQVYQFAITVTNTPQAVTGRSARVADAYLWVPPACPKIRGVLVLAQNVPEHWLAGHPAIRSACADSDLALLFTCRSFLMSDTLKDYPPADRDREHGVFLQRILDGLAAESGFDELRTVPWLPMGESMSLWIPTTLTRAYPERCIAGVHIKDGQWDRITSVSVPMLEALGTAAEWEQFQFDLFERWKQQAAEGVRKHVKKRLDQPAWPGSLLVEAGSAHFTCTDAMAQLLGQYIRAACHARLYADGRPALRPVDLDSGFVVGLPVPGSEPLPPTPYASCTPEQRSLPWYFDRACAQAAYDLAATNWTAAPQVPVFADAEGRALPFNVRGIFSPLRYTTLEDGITFQLAGTFLERLPTNFVKGGAALTHASDGPYIDWLCGPYIPLGERRFQISLDRTWRKTDSYARVWHPGDATHRYATNPGGLQFEPNAVGKPQFITFEAIPDQPAGAMNMTLKATSSAGLPVRFFVRAGPAVIDGNRLVFTEVPRRSTKPLKVSVVAWQWGRAAEPAVQTAELVERTFRLNVAPAN